MLWCPGDTTIHRKHIRIYIIGIWNNRENYQLTGGNVLYYTPAYERHSTEIFIIKKNTNISPHYGFGKEHKPIADPIAGHQTDLFGKLIMPAVIGYHASFLKWYDNWLRYPLKAREDILSRFNKCNLTHVMPNCMANSNNALSHFVSVDVYFAVESCVEIISVK